MTLGELIKLTRKQKDMTQPELAAAADIEQSYLSKLENDKCTPSYDVIQKVAKALDNEPLAMINQLNPEYTAKKLAHIPEVVAESAALKNEQLARLKKRFILASTVVIMGMGLFMLGQLSLIFPETTYTYFSDGIIKEGEPLLQFQSYEIDEIGESPTQMRERLNNNKARFDRQFLKYTTKQPSDFVVSVPDGRRFYQYYTSNTIPDIRNSLLAIFGMMVIISGCFGFWYIFRFKP